MLYEKWDFVFFFLPLFLDNDKMSVCTILYQCVRFDEARINKRNLFFVLIYIYIMIYFIVESLLIFIFLIFFQNILLLFWIEIIRWRDNQKTLSYTFLNAGNYKNKYWKSGNKSGTFHKQAIEFPNRWPRILSHSHRANWVSSRKFTSGQV